jgi:hypothetical protein
MGFLDVIRGKRKLAGPAPDRLFAMTTAEITLDTSLGIKTRGQAAIVFQALDTADFGALVKDMEEVVNATYSDAGTKLESSDDKFGYRWMILSDPDLEDLVVGVNAISESLESGGYGDRVLCAVFSFADAKGAPLYWIYNYKRGTFYPFVPSGGAQQRDTEHELKLKAQIGTELPVEPELERWFPLWGIPI